MAATLQLGKEPACERVHTPATRSPSSTGASERGRWVAGASPPSTVCPRAPSRSPTPVDLTGEGFAADIDQVVTDRDARPPLVFLCKLAGIDIEGAAEATVQDGLLAVALRLAAAPPARLGR